jgi:hypothetical protein
MNPKEPPSVPGKKSRPLWVRVIIGFFVLAAFLLFILVLIGTKSELGAFIILGLIVYGLIGLPLGLFRKPTSRPKE